MEATVFDMDQMRIDFCHLILRAKGATVAHFVAWLDLKVAEYKVYGHMILTNEENDSQPAFEGSSVDPSSWPRGDSSADQSMLFESQGFQDDSNSYTDNTAQPGFQQVVERKRKKPIPRHPQQKSAKFAMSKALVKSAGQRLITSAQLNLPHTVTSGNGQGDLGAVDSGHETEQSGDQNVHIKTETKEETTEYQTQDSSGAGTSFSTVQPMSIQPIRPRGRGRSIGVMSPRGRGGNRGGANAGRGFSPSSTASKSMTLQSAGHQAITEGGGHVCTVNNCGQRFASQHTLFAHMADHVQAEETYTCLICAKKFAKKSYLVQHQSTHVDISLSPFRCQYCGKPCSLKGNLKKHEARCQQNPQENYSTLNC